MTVGIGNVPGATITNAATPVAFTGAANPNTGAGFAADVGCIYYATTSATYWIKSGTGNTAWRLVRSPTDYEKGLDDAIRVLGTSDVNEANDSYAVHSNSTGRGKAGVLESNTAGITWSTQAGGITQVTTDGAAARASKLGFWGYSGPLASAVATKKWWMRSHFKITTAIDQQTKAGIGTLGNDATVQSMIGFVGTDFVTAGANGGSATKFTLTKWVTPNTPINTAGGAAPSTVDVDTNWHWADIYGLGNSTIYASVDNETPISISTAGMDAFGASYMPVYISCGTTAAVRTMQYDYWQFVWQREND